jgi:TnpA family transposase
VAGRLTLARGDPGAPPAGAAGYDAETLRRFFTLTPDDLALVGRARGDHNRLGLALLLAWARAEHRLASAPATLPPPVIAHVGAQLGLTPAALAGYGHRPATHTAHAALVCAHLHLRPFTARDEHRLRAFLAGAAAHTGNTAALLDAATDWLVREGVLRPLGETTLERLIYGARATAEEALFAAVAAGLADAERAALDALCDADHGVSPVARLAVPPRQASVPALEETCQRLVQVRAALPAGLSWGDITPNRRRQWAALVRRQSAQALRRYPAAKRHTLLLAFLGVRQEELTDAAVEMFDVLVGRVVGATGEAVRAAKLAQAEAYAEGARLFRGVAEVLLDEAVPPAAVRAAVFRRVPREQLGALVAVGAPAEGGEMGLFCVALAGHFRQLRAVARPLLRTLRFDSPRADHALLPALELLRALFDEGRVGLPPTAPVGFVPARWDRAVRRAGRPERHAWEACLLLEMRAALRAGDLTVAGSRRYTPWDAGLYTPADWAARRASWQAERGVTADGPAAVARALAELDALTGRVAAGLATNADARISKGKLALTALDRVEVPPESAQARDALAGLLPHVELPELLMEVDRWTGFTHALTHLTGRRAPTPEHLATIRPALFAVLVAEATNLGLATVARSAGLAEGQLTRVYDWYFREETLRQAIAALIAHHRTLPLTARFGAGTTSSSDGVRFGVAASALNARHHPRYFGMRRGVTVYSHVSDQGTQFWIDVVNCQLREATYVLDGLLYQETLPIQEHYTDTHGYTDILFGLFEVLGYRFAPRLRDLPDQVLARAQAGADYGALDGVLRQPIRGDLIARHWDDLHRLAASLKDGLAVPSLVIAKLQALPRQNPLQQALQELGRLAKTRHILQYVDDRALRRRVLIGLNKQERLHALARTICFGRQGRFGDRGYEAQLNRASALSLVINALIVWDTTYLAAAAAERARRGQPVPDAAWAHLTPLLWEHVHLVGQYRFEESQLHGELRPLRAVVAEEDVAPGERA